MTLSQISCSTSYAHSRTHRHHASFQPTSTMTHEHPWLSLDLAWTATSTFARTLLADVCRTLDSERHNEEDIQIQDPTSSSKIPSSNEFQIPQITWSEYCEFEYWILLIIFELWQLIKENLRFNQSFCTLRYSFAQAHAPFAQFVDPWIEFPHSCPSRSIMCRPSTFHGRKLKVLLQNWNSSATQSWCLRIYIVVDSLTYGSQNGISIRLCIHSVALI